MKSKPRRAHGTGSLYPVPPLWRPWSLVRALVGGCAGDGRARRGRWQRQVPNQLVPDSPKLASVYETLNALW